MSTPSQQPATQPVAAPSTPGRTAEGAQIKAVAHTLVLAYGLHPADITRIPEGTATDNYAVVDRTGRRHFAKVYRTREHLGLERASVELSEYCADGGVATARATRTREHELIETHGRLPMSLTAAAHLREQVRPQVAAYAAALETAGYPPHLFFSRTFTIDTGQIVVSTGSSSSA
ncbi:hypothetical protein AB0A05_37930 [Streptomyces sp. NPDC046374]|uniref:hypothetical protein n=1 Tax=Streptomyces sp. NPDC046374 TaxID=3154917 RepID=UPI0033FEDA43